MRIGFLKSLFAATLAFAIVGCSEDSGTVQEPDNPHGKDFRCSDRSISAENSVSSLVVLGNSLLMGNESFGVSASDSTKDYFARIDSAFRRMNPELQSQRVMAKTLEFISDREPLRKGLEEQVLESLSSATDLVLVQLGDNINLDLEGDLVETMAETILEGVCESAPNAKVVWVGEWYSTDRKQEALKSVAQRHNVQFIDISDLNTAENQGRVGDISTFAEERVQAISYTRYAVSGDTMTIAFTEEGREYEVSVLMRDYCDYPEESRLDLIGHQGVVTDAVMATHPNDQGFALIAERILNELGVPADSIRR